MCERLKQAVLKTNPAHLLLFGINNLASLWTSLFGSNQAVWCASVQPSVQTAGLAENQC